MTYLDKINKSVTLYKCPCVFVSVAIPHQAFTPREILRQFVVNDVQVMQRTPSDDIGDFGGDVNAASDAVMQFEDEFQARNFVRNEMADYIESKKSKQKSAKEESPKEEPPKEEPPKDQPPKEEPPKDQLPLDL